MFSWSGIEVNASVAMEVQAEKLRVGSNSKRARETKSDDSAKHSDQSEKTGQAEQIDDLIWTPFGVYRRTKDSVYEQQATSAP